MNDNTTVRIEVPESVTLRMNELLVESGTDRELASRIAESYARDILATYTALAVLPFDKSRDWKPGERFKVRGWDGSYPNPTKDRFGVVVRVERLLSVYDRVCVVMDGEDAVKAYNTDEMMHVRPARVDPEEVGEDSEPAPAEPTPEEIGEQPEITRAHDISRVKGRLLSMEWPNNPVRSRQGEIEAIAGVIFEMIETIPLNKRQAMTFADVERAIHTALRTPRLLNAQQIQIALYLISGKED